MFEESGLLFCLSLAHLTQDAHVVPFRVTRRDIPQVDFDKDLWSEKSECLPRPQARAPTLGHEDRLDRGGSRRCGRQGGFIDMTDVSKGF